MIKPPCKGCQERYPGCHDRCLEFKDYKRKLAEAKEARDRYILGADYELSRMAKKEHKLVLKCDKKGKEKILRGDYKCRIRIPR